MIKTFKSIRTTGLVCLASFGLFSNSLLLAANAGSDNNINFSNILHAGQFAAVAYLDKNNIEDTLNKSGYQLSLYKNIEAIQLAYYLATDNKNKKQIIAVRGTSNIENAFVNLALKLEPDTHTQVALHNGFAMSAAAVYQSIKPLLKADYTIETTGHSLGGAVAVILAMHLQVDNYKVGDIITFGQPKVTNVSGATRFDNLRLLRVVTEKDVVPLVPPFDPINMQQLDMYWHLGTEIILLKSNHYAILTGLNSMLRASNFTQEMLNENNLNHHQMLHYLQLIKEKLPTAKEVPFKNNFNLFNLLGFNHELPLPQTLVTRAFN